MRFCVCVVLALVLLIAQGLLFHLGVPGWAIPQGTLVCVVFVAFYEFNVAGAVTAFLVGMLLDMSAGVALGPWAGSYTVVYAVLAFLSQRLFVESKLVAISVVAFATLLAGGVFLLLAYEYQGVSRDELLMLIGQSLASAIVAVPIFTILSRTWKRSGAVGVTSGSVMSVT